MQLVCLDLEGVLVPEIWIEFAQRTGISELRRTTRDEPDYDKLMTYRLGLLKTHNLGLPDIQKVIADMGPMAGAKEGWATLAKNLKAEIDEEKIEAFGGTVSLPFNAGKNVAVKIIDARGIESLKIIRL